VKDGAQPEERIPSGIELQKYSQHLIIRENEIVSEAERAYRYGDAAAAEPAALDAFDTRQTGMDSRRNGNA
jgi:hypothetical protein